MQGQFRVFEGPLDPFAADMALQSMLVWARHQHGGAALPSSGESFRFFAPLPAGGECVITCTAATDLFRLFVCTGTVIMRSIAD